MDIAIYIHALGTGGAERVAIHLANHWADMGYRVMIITNAQIARDPYPIRRSVVIECLDVAGDTSGIAGAIKSNVKRVLALRKLFKENSIKRAVSFAFTANVTLAIARAGLQGFVAVGSERNYPPSEASGGLWDFLRKVSYRLLDSLVAQTDRTNHWLVKNTFSKRIVTIPNPVVYPLPVSAPVVQPPSNGGMKVILAVGRLEEQKQFEHLLAAFSLIHKEHLNWNLVIVGEGHRRKQLEEQAAELGINSNFILPGRVGNIGEWYERADIFVLCSKHEGFPNALLEAMAYGKAVVSYNCETGPLELIQDRVNGILVDPDNINRLAESVRKLIEDPKLRNSLSSKAKGVKEKYSSSSVYSSWNKVLRLENSESAEVLVQHSAEVVGD